MANRLPGRAAALLAWLIAMTSVTVARGQGQALEIIADTDTLVPGTPVPFSAFFQLNGASPDISGRNVVFGACCPTGIYAWFDGELRAIADLDTTFPGTGLPMGFDLSDGSSPTISGGNVAFSCRNGRPGPGAICAHIDGELRVIALSGVTQVPGSTATFGSFHMLDGASPSISGRNVAFVASAGGINGIYASINGTLEVVADNSTDVPGQPGKTFLSFGQLGGTSPSISGRNVAFIGVWDGGAGVYARINGELIVIAATGMPAPNGAGNFGTNFGQLEGARPSISGENVVFALSSAIFGYLDGSLNVIVDSDTEAPGSTGTFGGFPVSPKISGNNVGFGAGADGIGWGIFALIDNQLMFVAGQITPVPGHGDSTFDRFFLPDGVRPSISGGNVVFSADAHEPLDHSVNGIYAHFHEPPIPTASTWWLVALTVLLVTAGVAVLRRASLSQRTQ